MAKAPQTPTAPSLMKTILGDAYKTGQVRGPRFQLIRGLGKTPARLRSLGIFALLAQLVLHATTTGTAMAGSTQIVVQWLDGPAGLSTTQMFKVQGAFDDNAERYGYDSDGNDVGSGTTNFFLYAEDGRVDAVVQSVVLMHQQMLLPDGMRIGVAVYEDADRSNWHFRAAYPADLADFDITYGKN